MRLDREVRQRIDRLELPFNALGFDPYGISKRHLLISLTTLSALYRYYFSVETRGIEHVPPRGRAMIVGNHSGGMAIDAAMVIASCFLEMDPPRLAQGMVEKFINRFALRERVGVAHGAVHRLAASTPSACSRRIAW